MKHIAGTKKTSLILVLISFFLISSVPVYAQKMRRRSLADCLDMAMERNPAIKSAREELVKTRLRIREAYSSILPKISTDFTYAHTHTHMDDDSSSFSSLSLPEEFATGLEAFANSLKQPEDNYSLNIDLQQPVFDQGKYAVLKRQAYTAIDISQYAVDMATQEVFMGVIAAYISTLKASEMVKIARESRDRLAEHLRVTKRRFEVGQVAKNDVLRSEMELANAERNLIHAQTGLSLGNENLQKVLFIVEEPFLTLPVKTMEDEMRSIDEMIGIAYQKRPDLLQSLKLREIADMGVSLAKTDFFPYVSLFGRYSRTDEDFFPKDDMLTVGGSISIPIFEGGIRGVKLKRARHDLVLSEFAESELKRQIRVEVVEAYLALQDLRATLKAIDKQIEHAQENMRIVQLRYEEGEATNLDALDANLLLFQAKTDFANLNYDIIKAQFAIHKAIGELTLETVKGNVRQEE